MAKDTDDEDKAEVLFRMPRSLLAKLDEVAELKKAPHTKANRNATVCTILERAANEALRSR